jgi:hypothetical protein
MAGELSATAAAVNCSVDVKPKIEEGEIMTIEEQAQALEQSYATYHRQTSQQWRTPEDRREALNTLKGHLREAERCLNLPPTSDTNSARSKLILWVEMTKGTIQERESQR